MTIQIRTKHKDGQSITTNQRLAVLFLYSGLDLLQIEKSEKPGGGLRFVFDDPAGEALELETYFYDDGCPVTSARELLEADRQIRKAVRQFWESKKGEIHAEKF